jgi:hypothetical protein
MLNRLKWYRKFNFIAVDLFIDFAGKLQKLFTSKICGVICVNFEPDLKRICVN